MSANLVEWGLAFATPSVLFVLALRADEQMRNFVKIAALSVPISIGMWFLFNAILKACSG